MNAVRFIGFFLMTLAIGLTVLGILRLGLRPPLLITVMILTAIASGIMWPSKGGG